MSQFPEPAAGPDGQKPGTWPLRPFGPAGLLVPGLEIRPSLRQTGENSVTWMLDGGNFVDLSHSPRRTRPLMQKSKELAGLMDVLVRLEGCRVPS